MSEPTGTSEMPDKEYIKKARACAVFVTPSSALIECLDRLEASNQRVEAMTKTLKLIRSYDNTSEYGEGFCDYGCDTPNIARQCLIEIEGE